MTGILGKTIFCECLELLDITMFYYYTNTVLEMFIFGFMSYSYLFVSIEGCAGRQEPGPAEHLEEANPRPLPLKGCS